LQHFIFKLILLFSAILSVNSALAVPLSSVINSDIQQVEYRQTLTYTSLAKLSAVQGLFQFTKNDTCKKQLALSYVTHEYCFSKGQLLKLISTRVDQYYQQQTMVRLAFSSKTKKLYFQPVFHQSEDQPPLYKKRLS
jgi:hypothetical protein